MIRVITLTLVLSLAPLARSADAGPYEYLVVFLPGTVVQGSHSALQALDGGAYRDTAKTDALNALARGGWEVIAVTGASGADHAVYLRRRSTPP